MVDRMQRLFEEIRRGNERLAPEAVITYPVPRANILLQAGCKDGEAI